MEDMAAKASPAKPHRMIPATFTPSIFLNMAMQVDAMHEDLVTDYGKAVLVADLYRLDALLPD
jgi:hypothetical protein